jgi:radical SAM superfamily enzyme YgiQ (UPF0313 family)
MRVLLVKPRLSPATLTGGDYLEFEPLELEYLAAGLRGHDVELFDMRFEADLEARMARFQPQVVACTAYSVHVNNVRRILRDAKRIDGAVFTVVGGHHATLMPQDFQRPEIDAIVVGEGVYSFRELVETLERRLPLDKVAGICFRNGSDFVWTAPRDDVDRFDRFPLPDRSITRAHRHKYFYLWWRPAALLRGSIGCVYRCTFCPIWKAAGGKVAYRSPQSVADELVGLDEDFVYFCDDNAFFDSRRMETLYRLLKERAVKKEYFFFSRPEELVKRPDLVEKWAEIGLRQVFLGLEAVRPDSLRSLKKRMDAQTNREAIRLLKKNGIDPIAAFIALPEFCQEDFDRIYDFMNEMELYYSEFSVLTPLPGSDLYWEKKGELLTENYELFDNLHTVLPTRLRPRDFCRNLARLWIKVYSPLRAIRVKPAVQPPLSLARIPGELTTALRNYRAIRNGYKDMSTRHGQP